MKKTLILLVILAALIGVAVVSKNNKTKQLAVASTREKLLDKLDVNTVQKIVLKDGDKVATIGVTDNQWTVAERSGYRASLDKIRKTLGDLADQKVGRKLPIGKGAWGDVKLLESGDAGKTGFLVKLVGEADKPVKTLVLGINDQVSKVGQPQSPFGGGGNGRLVRVTDDGDTVWDVPSQFDDLQARPEDWIDKSFFNVQKIKSIDVTAPNPADSWKASRKAESDTEFTLENAKPDDSLDNIKAGLTSLLSSPTFNDVVPKDKAGADFMKDAWQAKISTFDGFNYTIKAVKKGEAAAEKYYLTMAVTADLVKERAPVKDEKPEDKKKKDLEFSLQKATLEEHLATDKKCEGWVYEMSSYSLGSLIKKKDELLKAKTTAGETNKDGSTTVKGAASVVPPKPPVLPAPQKPVTVATPPVSAPAPTPPLPSAPKMEVKPTPPANANPATGEAPAAPAKPPATATTPPVSVPAPAAAAPAPAAPKEEPKPATPPVTAPPASPPTTPAK